MEEEVDDKEVDAEDTMELALKKLTSEKTEACEIIVSSTEISSASRKPRKTFLSSGKPATAAAVSLGVVNDLLI